MCQGIRSTASLLPQIPFSASKNINSLNTAPRYQFNNDEKTGKTKKQEMGPPPGPPKNFRRRLKSNSSYYVYYV